MNDQLDIFDGAVPLANVRLTDPVTSRKAATDHPGRSPLRLAVLGVLFEVGACSDDDIYNRLCRRPGGPVNQGSVRKRRGELVQMGWVRPVVGPSGEPIERQSNSGSPMMVWTLTDMAKDRGMPDDR